MGEVLLFLLGLAGGFLAHAIAVKVSFKQRTIDHKIQVYEALISAWISTRNFVYQHLPDGSVAGHVSREFDEMYGQSQQHVGKAFLLCEDVNLCEDINAFNERLHRSEWSKLPVGEMDQAMEALRSDASELITRMRADVKSSTHLEWEDIAHILSGLRRGRPTNSAKKSNDWSRDTDGVTAQKKNSSHT